ncbi:pseudouridine-5'-phosphate glycosidase [Brevibacillus porteri]
MTKQPIDDAKKQGITGKQVTPFMLANVKERTGKLTAQIAVALNRSES